LLDEIGAHPTEAGEALRRNLPLPKRRRFFDLTRNWKDIHLFPHAH
jgi:uncharacterized NAD(P)/FAD-binding protein YdhS